MDPGNQGLKLRDRKIANCSNLGIRVMNCFFILFYIYKIVVHMEPGLGSDSNFRTK